ncbi:MAG TPA: hypothetical protein VGK67_33680 [Myxococcales bacterium]
MLPRFLVLVSAALGLALPLPSRAAAASDFARYLESAAQLYGVGDHARALEQLSSARAQPHGADDDVLALLWEGILHDELGDEERACEAFRTGLSLDLEAQLPVQVRQRIGLHFELEREKLRQLKKQAATVSPPRPPPPPPTDPAADARQPAAERPLRLWAIAPLAAGAAAALAGGAVLGVAKDRYDALMSGAASPADAPAFRDAGKTFQAVGWTLTAVGVAAAAAGALLLALPPGPDAPSARVGVVPALVPGGGGILVRAELP